MLFITSLTETNSELSIRSNTNVSRFISSAGKALHSFGTVIRVHRTEHRQMHEKGMFCRMLGIKSVMAKRLEV